MTTVKKITPSPLAFPGPGSAVAPNNIFDTISRNIAGQTGQQQMNMYSVPGDLTAINNSIAKYLPPASQAPVPSSSQPVAPQPAPAESPDLAALLQGGGYSSQMQSASTDDGSDQYLSAALAALQGAQGSGGGMPPSILGDLMGLVGQAPDLPTLDVNKMANDQISLQYGGQENAIKAAMQQLQNQQAQQTQAQQLYGSKADKSLQDIFAALGNDLTQGKQNTANDYAQASGQIGSSYDQAFQQLAALNSGITGQLSNSAKNLGIEQGITDPLTRILSGYQGLAGNNINAKANSLSGLASNQANDLAQAERQITGSQRQGATARADVQSQVENALAQIGLASQQGQNQYINQYATLEQQKPLALQQAIAALNNQQYEMQRQAAADRLAQITGLGGLDVKNQANQIAYQGNQQAQQTAISKAISDLLSKKSDQSTQIKVAQIGKTPTPLDVAKGISQIQQQGASTNLSNVRSQNITNPQPKPTAPYADILQQFLHSPEDGLWGSGGAGPRFTSTLQALIDAANTNKATGISYDPFQEALTQLDLNKDVTKYGLNKAGLQRALQLYYKGK